MRSRALKNLDLERKWIKVASFSKFDTWIRMFKVSEISTWRNLVSSFTFHFAFSYSSEKSNNGSKLLCSSLCFLPSRKCKISLWRMSQASLLLKGMPEDGLEKIRTKPQTLVMKFQCFLNNNLSIYDVNLKIFR